MMASGETARALSMATICSEGDGVGQREVSSVKRLAALSGGSRWQAQQAWGAFKADMEPTGLKLRSLSTKLGEEGQPFHSIKGPRSRVMLSSAGDRDP